MTCVFVLVDSSDFVRLDPSLAEELPRAIHDVMNSSSQSGSSISDNFRLVQPLHRGPNPYREGRFQEQQVLEGTQDGGEGT